MRKGKLTQAVLARSVLRVLERRREDIVRCPEYGCGYGAFDSGESEKGTAAEKADVFSPGERPFEAPVYGNRVRKFRRVSGECAGICSP